MKNFFLISVYFILVCILNVNGRYAICLSPRFIKIFRDLYDDNKDDHLTPDQKAILFTSMVVQPESLMLRVCSVLLVTDTNRYAVLGTSPMEEGEPSSSVIK